jgi:hypothetical protein
VAGHGPCKCGVGDSVPVQGGGREGRRERDHAGDLQEMRRSREG